MSHVAAASGSTSALEGYRNVAAIVAALTIMQGAVGALSVVGPLTLAGAGASSTAIGAVVSSYAFGFLLGAKLTPREVLRVGHIRCIAAFAAMAALAAGGLSASTAIAWWMAMQFVIGASVAGLLAAGESWVADAAPPEGRGAILGFYLVASKLGLVAGQILAASVGPGDMAGFLIVALLFTACLLPVAATRRAQPQPPTAEPFGPRKLWRTTPSAVIAAFIAGLVNGAVLQLYAVFARDLNPSNPAAVAALFNAFLIGGTMLAQWPAGLISDRIDRRVVIAGLAAVGAVTAFGLYALASAAPLWVILVLAGLWGAGALSYYGIAIAHAADRAAPGQATSMMSGILIIWGAGSIVGPLGAGLGIGVAGGAQGLFLFASIGLTALTMGMAYRRADTGVAAHDDKSDFAPSPATSVSAVELNPMADDDAIQLDLFDPDHVTPAPLNPAPTERSTTSRATVADHPSEPDQ